MAADGSDSAQPFRSGESARSIRKIARVRAMAPFAERVRSTSTPFLRPQKTERVCLARLGPGVLVLVRQGGRHDSRRALSAACHPQGASCAYESAISRHGADPVRVAPMTVRRGALPSDYRPAH